MASGGRCLFVSVVVGDRRRCHSFVVVVVDLCSIKLIVEQ